ncbi:hypothetical protein TNCV_2773391 [Trichonephila clavipes]|nr:hypothetical protein TNCV_2773391 [Trichonephila clavipes]
MVAWWSWYELVSDVRALMPLKPIFEEELMHFKYIEVQSPHVGVVGKFRKEVISAQRALLRQPPGVNEREGIQGTRTLDAEVDDPGMKKERRERWPSRDAPTRCSQERREGHSLSTLL